MKKGKLKKVAAILSGLMLCLTGASAPALSSCGKKADFTVGVCQLVRHNALDAATKGFKSELTRLLKEEGKTVEIKVQNAQGETATCATIVNGFVAQKVDLIMANATLALQAAVNRTKNIPILGTSVTDYASALGIQNFTGTVGGNVSGTSDLGSDDQLQKQAEMIVDLVPSAKTVGILYCKAEANSVYQVGQMTELLKGKGITVEPYPFSDSNDVISVTTKATTECDALFIPTDNTAAANAAAIGKICKSAKIPVIAGEEGICKGCGVATYTIDYRHLGEITGRMAAEILLGKKKISEMPIENDTPVYKYNPEFCTVCNITPPNGYIALE